MLKKLLLSAVVLGSVAAGRASACPDPPHFGFGGSYYERVARDWVRLYLRRNATAYEVLLITNQLRSGMSPEAVQANILASDEYYRLAGFNNIAWGQRVVADTLGRAETPYEQALMTQLIWQYGRSGAALLVLQSRNVPIFWY